MTWIEVVDESEASGELRTVYERIKGARGKLSNIMQVQSLAPKAMAAHLELYMALLFDRSGLTRAERELVAAMRAQGLADAEILNVNMIAAYFNFVNRIAEGLGVDSSPEEVAGYRY